MTLIVWIACAMALLYLFLAGWVIFHWVISSGRASTNLQAENLKVSVVVAARNEQDNLESCMEALLAQTWENLEIIVVDDHSHDKTWDILSQFEGGRCRIFRLQADDPTGKKEAVMAGVHHSKGEIVLLTDADCIPDPRWAETYARAFEDKEKALLTGPLYIGADGTMLGNLQYFESLGVIAFTAAGSVSQKFDLGNAANLGFRKRAFQEVDGYEGNLEFVSGDDVFLIEKIRERASGNIGFVKAPEALVRTNSSQSRAALIQQRLRWASKNHALKAPFLKRVWAGIWLYTAVMLLASISAMFLHDLFVLGFAILFTGKMIGDALLAWEVSRYYRLPFSVIRFTITYPVYNIYVLYIGIMAMIRPEFEWKGRKYS